ncbi:Protein M60.4 a [Aphelenchoides avenae]|nr:Protein M60.4 a [Aphelenchus avenae]
MAFIESNRFTLKLVLIAIGVLISLLYCGLGGIGYTGYRCYKEGQDGYTNSANALTLLLDVIFLVLNLILLSHSTLWRIELIYSVFAAILLIIAAGLMVWFFVVNELTLNYWWIAATVMVVLKAAIYVRDVHILQYSS